MRFNLENAHKGDVWALGLVVLTMLCGEQATRSANGFPDWAGTPDVSKMNIPPLPCLQDCFKRSYHIPDRELENIGQERLDQDLANLCKKQQDNYGETDIVWKIVGRMLQVDPQKRISAQEALALLENDTR
ncbi:MAG: hypothetical protein LVR00_05665 [Rhabdochlamydiaceae bacterium]